VERAGGAEERGGEVEGRRSRVEGQGMRWSGRKEDYENQAITNPHRSYPTGSGTLAKQLRTKAITLPPLAVTWRPWTRRSSRPF
jgi:hypothetical protein